jgi:hypothetical protein
VYNNRLTKHLLRSLRTLLILVNFFLNNNIMPFFKKKYTCAGKSEDEVRSDLYEACREGKIDWLNTILCELEFDINKLSEEQEEQQGYVRCRLILIYYI